MKPELLLSKKFQNLLKRRGDNFSFRVESSHTCPGIPDWIVNTKGGKIGYVELKAGHHVTQAQKVVHFKLARLNHLVFILTQKPNSVILKYEGQETEFDSLESCVDELIRIIDYGTEPFPPAA